MSHILTQFFTHVLFGPFLIAAIFFALRYWIRRNAKVARWVSPNQPHLLVLAAVLVFCLVPLREAYDLYFGRQTIWKTVTDQLSWIVSSGLGGCAIYRLMKM